MLSLLLALASLAQGAPEPSPEDKIAGLNQLVDTFDNQRDWSENDRLIAVEVAKSARDVWKACLTEAEERLGRSTEAVETVATAVVGSCTMAEHTYERAVAASFRGIAEPSERSTQAQKIVQTYRATRREEVIARLVAARLPPPKTR